MKKRIFSFLMALVMVLSILPMPVLAAEGCANHPAHDASCGYVAAVEGQPCHHQHSEACRVEATVCTHVHAAECYPDGNMEGEPTLCGHVCSEESGCVTVSCSHVHDEACGYVEAVTGQPCGHSCEVCNPPVCICDVQCNEMVNGECPVCAGDASLCTGKAPEVPGCVCQSRCTGDAVNTECPVCGADLTKCAVPEASNDLPPVPQAVVDVQTLIDALPGLEEVQAMEREQQFEVYNQTQGAYGAYEQLSAEEKALVTGAEVFEGLFNYFNSLVTLLPVEAVTYVDQYGAEHICEDYISVIDQTEWMDGWYVVDNTVTIEPRINVNGTVNLILLDGCTLNAAHGIQVNSGSFTIYGQSKESGYLNATGVDNGTAGIGVGECTLTINSGAVTASGAWRASGIGGNYGSSAGTINIHGGKVTATGTESSAGIGAACYGSIEAINITGGTIYAETNSGYDTRAIGSGEDGSCGSITISGGTITTNCGGPGIGASGGATCGKIEIGPDAVVKDKNGRFPGVSGGSDVSIAISSVTLDQSTLSLLPDSTATLTATVWPNEATEVKAVTWASDKPEVATVENGTVTAVAPGTATITATAGGKSASCTVTVTRVPVEYLDADGNKQTCTDYTPVTEDMIIWGEAGKDTWYVVDGSITIPDNPSDWMTEEISIKGTVHLILKESCILTTPRKFVFNGNQMSIYAQNNTSGQLVANGTFSVGNGSLTINSGKIIAKNVGSWAPISVGTGGTITINGGTINAKAEGNLGYVGAAIGNDHAQRSSGGNIIINGGYVTAYSEGGEDIGHGKDAQNVESIYISRNATIQRDDSGTLPQVGQATVSRIIETKTLTMASESMTKTYGDAPFTPSVTAYPSITTEKPVWASSDASVATVDADGKVTIVGAGNANITASIENTPITATCALTVNPKPLTVTLAGTPTKVYDGTTSCDGNGLSLTVEGVLTEDDVAHTVTYIYSDANVGDRTVTADITLSGTDAGNYKLPEAPVTVAGTITAKVVTAPVIELSSDTFVYDGTEKQPTVVSVKDGTTVIPNTEYSVAYKIGEEDATTFTEAGKYTVVITDNKDGNYTVNGSTTFTITQSGTTFEPNGVKTYLDTEEKNTFVYEEEITVKVTPKATGVAAPKVSLFSFAEQKENQLAIFWNGDQVSEPQAVTSGTELTFTVKTTDLGVGEKELTAKYLGNDNMADHAMPFTVTINQASVDGVDTPAPNAVTYGKKLADIKLPEGWVWADKDAVPTVTNSGYTAYYAIADDVNYNWTNIPDYDAANHRLERTVPLTVNKANPDPATPKDLTAATGQTLADVELPKGWTWDAPNTTMKNPVGKKTFPATFTPDDTDNFNTVSKTLTVNVDSHVVTFNSGGGTAVAPVIVKDGKFLKAPEAPTREVIEGEKVTAWAFAGWYKDAQLKERWLFEGAESGDPDKVTDTMTLYAKWNVLYSYSLIYEENTTSKVTNMPDDFEDNLSANAELKLRIPGNKPKRSGYSFAGWNTQANGKGTKYQPGDDVPGIKDGTVTLYAQWKQNSGSWWDNPKTGDYIMIAVGVLAVSGAALAGLLVYSKKKKK